MSEHILSTKAMQKADQLTISELGLSSLRLMENAGLACLKVLQGKIPALAEKTFLIICGKGQNGGDGFVIARLLYNLGANVKVLQCFSEIKSKDSLRNLGLLSVLAERENFSKIQIINYTKLNDLQRIGHFDYILDAVFGTGFRGPLEENIEALFTWVNRQNADVISIDLPSGLQSDDGKTASATIKASLTITIAAKKIGLLINRGPEMSGEVEVADIGIPPSIISIVIESEGGFFALTQKELSESLPKRLTISNKYSNGLGLVLAGSKDYVGAAYLSSTATARTGAGMVICACPENIQAILQAKFSEIIAVPLLETPEGLAVSNLKLLLQKAERASGLLIGPGLGRQKETQELIRSLACQSNLPLVLDADGLNAFVGQTQTIAQSSKGQWVLTPHWGEFCRLTEIESEVSLEERPQLVRKFAKEWNCILLLKGFPCFIGMPDGRLFVNQSGNPALATAGTGDVLAGLITGFLAQGIQPEKATLMGVFLGGLCADRYITNKHPNTMLASDLLNELPFVMKELDLV